MLWPIGAPSVACAAALYVRRRAVCAPAIAMVVQVAVRRQTTPDRRSCPARLRRPQPACPERCTGAAPPRPRAGRAPTRPWGRCAARHAGLQAPHGYPEARSLRATATTVMPARTAPRTLL